MPPADFVGPTNVIDLAGKDKENVCQAVWMTLNILTGHVNTRNLSGQPMTFPRAMGVEADMEVLSLSTSIEWGNSFFYDHHLFPEIEGRQLSSFLSNNIRKHLHLPSTLKATGDEKYNSSRVAAIDLSRHMVRIYEALHNGERPLVSL